MEREDDTIELGTASVETKGNQIGQGDVVIGRPDLGLSDD
jgi:hypothetical protein